ncbi:MAG: ABC transporter permease [Haloarculaceae archaeon]
MSPPDAPRFRQVDWEEIGAGGSARSTSTRVLLVGLAILAVLFGYSLTVTHGYLLRSWSVTPLDWLAMLATVVLAAYGVVPAVAEWETTKRVLAGLRTHRGATLAGLFLVALVIVGFLGPIVLPTPKLRFQYAYNPPFGFSSGITPSRCVGAVTGPVFHQRCHGSLLAPLGTNKRGLPMTYLLVTGARTTLYVLVVTAAFVVPLAAAVGVVAGLRGGLVDSLLTGYVDVQMSVPAIVVYFLGYAYFGPSLLLLLVAFGLFSWGGVARLVRSEVLQRREDGHVLVARQQGASWSYLARRHVLPNVTNTLVPAVFHLLALLVLVEAGVAFLGFHQLELYSWGSTISESLNAAVGAYVQTRAEFPAYRIWWVSTFPALALGATLLSLKLVGDGLRDALDPRGEP